MKQAFSMIELIFVIVILGVLAAVAIPKLNATRNDAELSVNKQNISIIINDLISYYVANNKFSDDIKTMTNVGLKNNYYMVKDKHCLKFETDDEYIVVSRVQNTHKVCETILKDEKILANLTGKKSKTDDTITNISKSYKVYIQAGGTKVVL